MYLGAKTLLIIRLPCHETVSRAQALCLFLDVMINDRHLIGVITSHPIQGCHYGLLIMWKIPLALLSSRLLYLRHDTIVRKLRESLRVMEVVLWAWTWEALKLGSALDNSCNHHGRSISPSRPTINEYLINPLNFATSPRPFHQPRLLLFLFISSLPHSMPFLLW